jgi:hypothetical protein
MGGAFGQADLVLAVLGRTAPPVAYLGSVVAAFLLLAVLLLLMEEPGVARVWLLLCEVPLAGVVYLIGRLTRAIFVPTAKE